MSFTTEETPWDFQRRKGLFLNCFLKMSTPSWYNFIMETISISTGDLYDEAEILNWLMVQKDPAGELIEHVDGSDLKRIIVESNALAVYFCKLFFKYNI